MQSHIFIFLPNRPSSRSGSMSRDRPGSGRGRSSSADGRRRSASTDRSPTSVSSAGKVSVRGDDVKIEVR